MRAIVTGGAGFIGSHLVEELLKARAEILVIDDLSTGRRENIASLIDSEKIDFAKLDITSSEARAAVEEFQPDSIFHLAAQMNVRKSVESPRFDAEVNVVGTVNLLDAASRCGVKDFVFASTGGAIYGEQVEFPATESHPFDPECPYGVAKRCGEMYMQYFARAGKLRSIALRFANVYGPRQNPKGEAGVVAIFCQRIKQGQSLTINGDGEQTRDFIYVGDVVRALALAPSLGAPRRFEAFNVGTGRETSLLQIVDALRRAWAEKGAGFDFPEVSHGPAVPGEQRRSVISPAKLIAAAGWNLKVGLQEGLALTLDSFGV